MHQTIKQYTFHSLYVLYKKNRLVFSNPEVRVEMPDWSPIQKNLFIDSVMKGFPLNPIYTIELEDSKIWVVDGVQRLKSIFSYIESDGYDNLPEEDRQQFSFSSVNIVSVDLGVKGEREILEKIEELYFRISSGRPLSNEELERCLKQR